MTDLTFDLILHLAGEQILPNYMAMKLCPAQQHICVATGKTLKQVPLLQREFSDCVIRPVEVPSHDYSAILAELRPCSEFPKRKRVGFNVTGGTKPMFAAALDFCRASGAVPFYLDSQQRKIYVLAELYPVLDMPPVFDSVETFVRLAGYRVQSPGLRPTDPAWTEERSALAKRAWASRSLVRKHMAKMAPFTDKKYRTQESPPDAFVHALMGALDEFLAKDPDLAALWKAVFPDAKRWRQRCGYLAGGWFEEFCFCTAAEAAETGIADIRMGLYPGWADDQTDDPLNAAQEFDVAFTDGYGLALVECKAGAIKQEHFQKLENLTSVFGGVLGRGVLACIDRPLPTFANRARMSRNTVLACGPALERLPDCLRGVKPGSIIQE